MRRQRRSKIVATLGPASGERAIISRLFEAGADVFRINMSHTSHARMRELVATIRSVEAEHGRPIGILVDLQGPKLRLGAFKNDSATIDKGQDFIFDTDPTPGDAARVNLPHAEIFAAIKPGDTLLIDDGKLRLLATDTGPQRIVARVEIGGKISNRKGVSLPDTVIPLAALAPKDIADLEAALDTGIDWVALSFIQRPEDIAEAKKITRGRAAVMAKIEKPQAVARLDDILDLADALMVARGDLGVEMPLEKVPGVQKDMTRACRRAGKPVVVATQMLESMIASPVPTRAEVSDVATAIFDGADAVMLSAGSACRRIIAIASSGDDEPHRRTGGTRRQLSATPLHAATTEPEATSADAIAAAARRGAEDARSFGHRLLDIVRLDGTARLARAAAMSDRRALADRCRRTQIVDRLGHSWCARRRRPRSRRHDRPCLPSRLQGRFRQGGTAHHRRRRRSARHARRHERDADCFRRRSAGYRLSRSRQLLDQGNDPIGIGVMRHVADAGKYDKLRGRDRGSERHCMPAR